MKKIKLTAAMLAAALAVGTAASATFSDTVGQWYEDEVEYARANGLIDGYEDNLFHPDDNVTLAQMCAIISRAADAEIDAPADGGYWAEKYVEWAGDNGIYGGFVTEAQREKSFELTGGKSIGERTLTREQLVDMIYRLYCMGNAAPKTDTAALAKYSDKGEVSDYANEAMRWATAAGIIEGDNGELFPAANVTRAQTAAILTRCLEGLEPASDENTGSGAETDTENKTAADPKQTVTEYATKAEAEAAAGFTFPTFVMNDFEIVGYYTVNETDADNVIIGCTAALGGKSVTVRMGRGDRDIASVNGGNSIEGMEQDLAVDWRSDNGTVYATWSVTDDTDDERNTYCYSAEIEDGTADELVRIVNAIGAETISEAK